jgi:hypothetical protein
MAPQNLVWWRYVVGYDQVGNGLSSQDRHGILHSSRPSAALVLPGIQRQTPCGGTSMIQV